GDGVRVPFHGFTSSWVAARRGRRGWWKEYSLWLNYTISRRRGKGVCHILWKFSGKGRQKFPHISPGISAQATHILKSPEGNPFQGGIPWHTHPSTRPRFCAAAWRRPPGTW